MYDRFRDQSDGMAPIGSSSAWYVMWVVARTTRWSSCSSILVHVFGRHSLAEGRTSFPFFTTTPLEEAGPLYALVPRHLQSRCSINDEY
jgi:hypothetical protein